MNITRSPTLQGTVPIVSTIVVTGWGLTISVRERKRERCNVEGSCPSQRHCDGHRTVGTNLIRLSPEGIGPGAHGRIRDPRTAQRFRTFNVGSIVARSVFFLLQLCGNRLLNVALLHRYVILQDGCVSAPNQELGNVLRPCFQFLYGLTKKKHVQC